MDNPPNERKTVYLPFPKPFYIPIPKTPQEIPVNPAIIPESCE